jgi:hypothetical protein
MSAKTVTGGDGTAREAVLRAMQEAAEQVAGKNGVPKGPKGTKGIVMLSTDVSWTSPDDDKKRTRSGTGMMMTRGQNRQLPTHETFPFPREAKEP